MSEILVVKLGGTTISDQQLRGVHLGAGCRAIEGDGPAGCAVEHEMTGDGDSQPIRVEHDR